MTLYTINDMSSPYGVYTATVNETNGISAGDLVKPTGSTEATTSNYSTPIASSLLLVSACDGNGDEALVSGIALDDQTDGLEIPIATRGLFLMQANESTTQGKMLSQMGSATAMKVVDAEAGGRQIGIALSGCNAQNEYVLVLFGLGPTGTEG